MGPQIPCNLFGGISAVDYLGDDRYLAVSDRGPLDGAVDWVARVHIIRIKFSGLKDNPPSYSIEKTIALKEGKRTFNGVASQFESDSKSLHRLDLEGVRIAADKKSFFVSDEYGPLLLQFDWEGQLIRRLPVPSKFKIAKPGLTKKTENSNNQSGRQCNRGMEGLAVSDNGKELWGLMQSPLIQDSRTTKKGKLKGHYCRILQSHTDGPGSEEFAYQLDSEDYKLNEILASGPGEFLVIERDGEPGEFAEFKKVMKISVAAAQDISQRHSLPHQPKPEIKSVEKSVLIDLLDPRFKLAGKKMPEKIESLSWGPNMADGRKTLIVVSDNDFKKQSPTMVYCFAIGKPTQKLKNERIATRELTKSERGGK
ncbi:MAG: esterase-like activity of phytase family protein [Planctomycetota bacterium]